MFVWAFVPPLRQGQRCSRISLYVSIFVGVTLIPWYINQLFRLITLLLPISICEFVRKMLALLDLLIRSGNVKTNPGPYNTKSSNLSFGVWNTIPARDYARIPLIETLQATYNFDIFSICESSLTGNISNDDIIISGFSQQPFRSDKPALLRNGGVCLYYKENLPIKERGDLEILDES